MKTYPLTSLSSEVWREIDFIFWRHEVPCLIKGSTGDGFIAENIETNKHGVVISGTMTFLGGRSGYFEHPMVLQFTRPRFSSLDSISPEKVRKTIIADSGFDGKTLHVSVA